MPPFLPFSFSHSFPPAHTHVDHGRLNERGEEEAEPPLYSEADLQSCLDKIEVIDFQQARALEWNAMDACRVSVWLRLKSEGAGRSLLACLHFD